MNLKIYKPYSRYRRYTIHGVLNEMNPGKIWLHLCCILKFRNSFFHVESLFIMQFSKWFVNYLDSSNEIAFLGKIIWCFDIILSFHVYYPSKFFIIT